ncbi:MAG: hypothetical protein II767_06420, partial [Proteobacteria bacterium]|nr:hypothetical protein [Pseudomonadota bacterium]
MTDQPQASWQISFDSGSLTLKVPPEDTDKALSLLPQFVWDQRIGALRGSAHLYRRLLIQLTRN